MKPLPAEVPAGFRDYFRQHNRHAVFVAFYSLLGAIAAWAITYLLVQWMSLLFLTTIRGLDVPASVGSWPEIGVGVVALLVFGLVVRNWKTQNHRFNLLLVLAGFISLPSRLTFAVFDNLRAQVFPNADEIAGCWFLLSKLQKSGKIPIHELGGLQDLGIGSERLAYLLGITGLAETDLYGGIFYLHPKNEETRRLCRRWSRSLELEDSSSSLSDR